MKSGFIHRERGAALLALVAVIMLAASWLLVRQLNSESGGIDAVRKNRNAEVLNRAKQALIGYVAAQAAKDGENRPGALPCPEASADFNVAASEGTVSYPCTLPKVGRFPWRSLGLDKLVDASGEPLWYAIASGWAGASTVINSNCATYNIAGFACSTGRLTVDGVTDDVIALIIAPGPAFNVVASGANCAAISQTRPTAGAPDWRNYLECENATYPTPDATFVTTGPSGSFNDQVVKITAAELMPAVEAAISNRIEREIVPVLQSVYAGGSWGIPGANPVYPFAAPFADPSTSAMQGTLGTLRGLLPLATSETAPSSRIACATGASAPLCQPDFVAWTLPTLAGAGMLNPNCTATAGATLTCNFYRSCFFICGASTQNYSISATITNVGMALRQKSIDVTKMTNVGTAPAPVASVGSMTSAGAAPFTISGTAPTTAGSGLFGALGSALCGIALPLFNTCKTETITIPMNAVLVDHPFLDSTTTGAGATGWFIRNKWHELTYYVVASGFTPAVLPAAPACSDGSTCLVARNPAGSLTTLNGGIAATDTTLVVASSSGAPATNFRMQVDAEVMRVTAVAGTTWTVVRGTEGSSAASHNDQSRVKLVGRDRAIVILAGRSINGSVRPSATLADYLEFGNATAANERQTITAAIPSSYVDTGGANAYSLASASPVNGRAFQFKALTTNTGASTLSTPSTGAKGLVNSDGTPLAASAIQTNAAVQVDYDGTQFLLTKRPFNDRIVVIQANP
jgi:hypothetical protein